MLFSWLKNLQWLLMIKKVKPSFSMVNKAFFDLFFAHFCKLFSPDSLLMFCDTEDLELPGVPYYFMLLLFAYFIPFLPDCLSSGVLPGIPRLSEGSLCSFVIFYRNCLCMTHFLCWSVKSLRPGIVFSPTPYP